MKIQDVILELIERAKTPRGNKSSACKLIAKELGVNHKTVLIISNGGYAGKALKKRIRILHRNGKIEFTPRYRMSIEFHTEAELRQAQELYPKMKDRRERLLR